MRRGVREGEKYIHGTMHVDPLPLHTPQTSNFFPEKGMPSHPIQLPFPPHTLQTSSFLPEFSTPSHPRQLDPFPPHTPHMSGISLEKRYLSQPIAMAHLQIIMRRFRKCFTLLFSSLSSLSSLSPLVPLPLPCLFIPGVSENSLDLLRSQCLIPSSNIVDEPIPELTRGGIVDVSSECDELFGRVPVCILLDRLSMRRERGEEGRGKGERGEREREREGEGERRVEKKGILEDPLHN